MIPVIALIDLKAKSESPTIDFQKYISHVPMPTIDNQLLIAPSHESPLIAQREVNSSNHIDSVSKPLNLIIPEKMSIIPTVQMYSLLGVSSSIALLVMYPQFLQLLTDGCAPH